jgi:hypothetical protein
VNAFTSAHHHSGKEFRAGQPLETVSFVTARTFRDPRSSTWARDDAPYPGRVPETPVPSPPPPLVVAASLAALEGLLLVGYGVLEAADLHADRAAMGVTTSLFFALLGGMMGTCAWLVVRGRAWARSPIIVAQVMFLGLAWNFLGGSTTWVSIALAVVALVVLGGLLHPASIQALAGDHDR